jgi:hypothetical protein
MITARHLSLGVIGGGHTIGSLSGEEIKVTCAKGRRSACTHADGHGRDAPVESHTRLVRKC